MSVSFACSSCLPVDPNLPFLRAHEKACGKMSLTQPDARVTNVKGNACCWRVSARIQVRWAPASLVHSIGRMGVLEQVAAEQLCPADRSEMFSHRGNHLKVMPDCSLFYIFLM